MKGIKKAVQILKNGGVGVGPTDTLYGLMGSALNQKAVERIYELKKREADKPFIVLIADVRDLELFGVEIDVRTKNVLSKLWPGQVSIILPCPKAEMSYLHRGTKTLAFRLAKPKWLRDFLRQTGPLVAPSANLEGEKPAETTAQAKKIFGQKVDFYLDNGTLTGLPSTLLKIENNAIVVLRQGAVRI